MQRSSVESDLIDGNSAVAKDSARLSCCSQEILAALVPDSATETSILNIGRLVLTTASQEAGPKTRKFILIAVIILLVLMQSISYAPFYVMNEGMKSDHGMGRGLSAFNPTFRTFQPYYSQQLERNGRDNTTQRDEVSSSEMAKCWNFEERCAVSRNWTNVANSSLKIQAPFISDSSTHLARTTLALADPFLRDGYRNQFMRFVTFTTYALTNGFHQILLPSIRWNCDHRKTKNVAVPFELLFDVDHWNTNTDLPRLVGFNESEHYDWEPSTGLFRGACDVLNKYFYGGPGLKDIIMRQVKDYQHPSPFGGGKSLGVLFYDYVGLDRRRPKVFLKEKNISTKFLEVEAKITRAMRPSVTVERLIRETLGGDGRPPTVALHARFEPEMLIHNKCKQLKVYNLTDVFDMIRGTNFTDTPSSNMYIAIGLKEMEEGNPYKWFQAEHRLNMAALSDAMSYGLDLPSGENLTVTVGGHIAIRSEYIDSCAHEIVSAAVSFEIAVRAKIFIGTYISSWSTTVWKARHYLGQGENYAYTPSGLERIEGVPKPFIC